MNFGFSKKEHLFGRKNIETLFSKGNSLFVYPFRVVYMIREREEGVFPVRVLISVPKKRFKLAVDRNRLKRVIRECYRLNKNELIQRSIEEKKILQIAFQYVAKEKMNFTTLNDRMKLALNQIEKKLLEKKEEQCNE